MENNIYGVMRYSDAYIDKYKKIVTHIKKLLITNKTDSKLNLSKEIGIFKGSPGLVTIMAQKKWIHSVNQGYWDVLEPEKLEDLIAHPIKACQLVTEYHDSLVKARNVRTKSKVEAVQKEEATEAEKVNIVNVTHPISKAELKSTFPINFNKLSKIGLNSSIEEATRVNIENKLNIISDTIQTLFKGNTFLVDFKGHVCSLQDLFTEPLTRKALMDVIIDQSEKEVISTISKVLNQEYITPNRKEELK